jgi:nucleotide-binding universal stress UspA family protein
VSIEEKGRTERELLGRAEGFANRATDELQEAGFHTESVVNVGHAARRLLEEAESRGADMIVVGSRGLGPVRRSLTGSVSDRVARHGPAALIARRLQT